MIIQGPWAPRKMGILESAACVVACATIQVQAQRNAAEAAKRQAETEREIAHRRYLEILALRGNPEYLR